MLLLATVPVAYLLVLATFMSLDACAGRDCRGILVQAIVVAVKLTPGIVAGAAVIVAVVMLVLRRRAWWIPLTGIVVMFVVLIVLGELLPAAIAEQPFEVNQPANAPTAPRSGL
ncbi:hypothetical protein [Agromyces sp. CCNWLW203]|uniref:hypothetical protein n=1 Tax=Agromyces sp. CCNWLW203 TaxID=3112842 RepID=UPI002F9682A0